MSSDSESESEEDEAVCIICCKSVSVGSDNRSSSSTNLKLLFRQLKLEAQLLLTGKASSIITCLDCSTLLRSYGKLYHVVKVLELQLQWKITKLSDIMRSAGRVPKRMKAFKVWCHNQGDDEKASKEVTITHFRSQLRRGCKNYQKKSLPRVHLRRLDEEVTPLVVDEAHNKSAFLGWLISLVTVTILSDFKLNLEETSDACELELADVPVDESDDLEMPTLLREEPLPQLAPSEDAPSQHNDQDQENFEYLPEESVPEIISMETRTKVSRRPEAKRPQCAICNIYLSCGYNLNRHMRRYHDTCTSSRKIPEKIPMETPPVRRKAARQQCAICKIYLCSRSSLKRHMRRYHDDSKLSRKILYKCYKCNRLLSRIDHLKSHMQRQHAGYPIKFILSIKGLKSLNSSSRPVKRSLERVTDTIPKLEPGLPDPFKDRMSQCSKCGRWFADSRGLRRHKERKACRFTQQRELLMRLNSTLDFTCQLCNFRLRDRSALESHVACRHRFHHDNAVQYKDLDVKSGQAAGMFFCAFCGVLETSRRALTSHFRRKHWNLFGVPKETTPLKAEESQVKTGSQVGEDLEKPSQTIPEDKNLTIVSTYSIKIEDFS